MNCKCQNNQGLFFNQIDTILALILLIIWLTYIFLEKNYLTCMFKRLLFYKYYHIINNKQSIIIHDEIFLGEYFRQILTINSQIIKEVFN